MWNYLFFCTGDLLRHDVLVFRDKFHIVLWKTVASKTATLNKNKTSNLEKKRCVASWQQTGAIRLIYHLISTDQARWKGTATGWLISVYHVTSRSVSYCVTVLLNSLRNQLLLVGVQIPKMPSSVSDCRKFATGLNTIIFQEIVAWS